MNGHGDGDGAGTGTGVEVNEGAQDGNGDGAGTVTGTGVGTRRRTPDGNGDGNGDGSEDSSGDGNGDDDNGNGNENRIGQGGREAKKRKKPQNSCRQLAAGTIPNSLYRMPLVYLFLACVFCYSCSFLFVVFCVCVFFCSHWSFFVDVPLIFFCPADHVPDWQPRILLGMVEARSVDVKKTTILYTGSKM